MNSFPQTSQPGAQHDLPVEALDYDLPERLIARRPAEPRDAARLMVVHLGSDRVDHRHVRDLPDYVQRGDLMIFNNTAVLPARIVARRVDSGGQVEGLFLHEAGGCWQMMLRSNGKLRTGQVIELLHHDGAASGWRLKLEQRLADHWLVQPELDFDAAAVLDQLGRTPLPPYILKARSHAAERDAIADALDRDWYQTVYADRRRQGSVAAPTAGLHFTAELCRTLDARGADRRQVTLHVGPGTFKPVQAATLGGHAMHREWYEVPADVLKSLHDATCAHRRVLAVGTTTVRTLESLPSPLPKSADGPVAGETELLIAPGYRFKLVQGLLTNFHLPRSTLLALVGAMVGLDRLLELYDEAIQREYRFYSYGDAMLILP